MKVFISLILFISFKVNAIEPLAFRGVYPGFKNYQSLLFNDLKTYFDQIQINSVIYADSNSMRILKVRRTNGTELATLRTRIIRTISGNQISERVIYSLENGNQFDYELIRKGTNLLPLDDDVLLSFTFELNKEESYRILVPSLNIQISYEQFSDLSDKSFFSLGFMEFNIQVETSVTDREAKRSYIYFFKNIKPSPQASLVVRAVETDNEWSGMQYFHSASQAGEITPQQFFGGLADGAGAFSEASAIIPMMMTGLGFPGL